ncbi:MAG TPA: lysophospholipid acyltransferase family protein [Blastocatellia bacterium]|nr:lysophospholipid acyltransferase family protein [Blastocatellia bacterium]
MLAFLRFILRPIFRLLFTVEYHGLENVPESGPVILAGNHPSYLDPILVALPLERVVKFMAWDALFKVSFLRGLIRKLGAFPVDIRRGKGEAAYREARKVLEAGDALGIFPEGQRSERGPMGELRTGVARLAIATGAPIVPVTLGGAFRAWPRYRLLPKPAKIIVRFHEAIRLDETERAARSDDRAYHQDVMQLVAKSINRSLAPAMRGTAHWERWYHQPPSHLRTYEYGPLIQAAFTSVVAGSRREFGGNWVGIWLPVVVYYVYLIADIAVIKPSRSAKWLRNSAPVWMMIGWHHLLTRALAVPAGELNIVLAGATLVGFFAFFWEDYYTLQKFVRGLVVVYYTSLALLIIWPHQIGQLVSVFVFIAVFNVRYRTIYYRVSAPMILASMILAIAATGSASRLLVIYAALSVVAVVYLQTFITAAYDIRKAGEVRQEATNNQ